MLHPQQLGFVALLLLVCNGVTQVRSKAYGSSSSSSKYSSIGSSYYRSSDYDSYGGYGSYGGSSDGGFMSDMHGGDMHGMMGGSSRLHQSKCIDIPANMTLCRNIGYTQMRLPNLLEHDTLREVGFRAYGKP
jgi:hypothetical protein